MKNQKDKKTTVTYELHELSVLRGVCDRDPGKYFGSTMNLTYWIQEAKDKGLITGDYPKLEPSVLGREIYDRVLSHLQNGRATFWHSVDLDQLLGEIKNDS